MPDTSSTLSVGVRTGAALEDLAKLKKELVDVVQLSSKLSATRVIPSSTTGDVAAAASGMEKLAAAEKAATEAASKMQISYSRAVNGLRVGVKNVGDDVGSLSGAITSVEKSTTLQAMTARAELEKTALAYEKQAAVMKAAFLNNPAKVQLAAQQELEAAANKTALAYEKQAAVMKAAFLNHAAEMDQLSQAEAAAGLSRREATAAKQLSLSQGYYRKSLSQRVSYLQQIERLQASGEFSTATIARTMGVSALGDMKNLPGMLASTGQASAESVAARDLLNTRRQIETLENRIAATRKGMGATLVGNNAIMRDGHSAARGFLGTLRATWLTWGSFAPLLAGAGLGAAITNTVGVGKDLEYQLKFIQALGNEAISTQDMMPAVQGSMKTPVEAAEGLRALAQAGLTSKQSLQALNTVLNLSTVGELSMEQAAVSVTGALAAFNLNAAQASRVGDAFAKAAAISNTSVQKISESMRQASTNAAQYHVSLEEVTASLATMAQRNITGTMAGTSFRNMLNELYAPRGTGQKAMNILGFSAYDAESQAKPFIQVLEELRNNLSRLDEQSRNSALQNIFGERGSKAIKPLLEDLDGYKEKLQEVSSASGFLSAAQKELADTVEGAETRLKSSLQQSFSKAFEDSKSDLRDFLDQLNGIASSQGFVTFLKDVTGGVIRFTDALIANRDSIQRVIEIYAGMKGLSIIGSPIVGGLQTLGAYSQRKSDVAAMQDQIKTLREHIATLQKDSESLEANTVAQASNTASKLESSAANAAAAGSSKIERTATGLSKFAGGAGKALTALASLTSLVGWVAIAFELASTAIDAFGKHTDTATGFTNKYLDNVGSQLQAVQKQIQTVDEANRKMLHGADPNSGATAQDIFQQQLSSGQQLQLQEIARAKSALDVAKAYEKSLDPMHQAVQIGGYTLDNQQNYLQAQQDVIAAQKRLNDLSEAYARSLGSAADMAQRIADLNDKMKLQTALGEGESAASRIKGLQRDYRNNTSIINSPYASQSEKDIARQRNANIDASGIRNIDTDTKIAEAYTNGVAYANKMGFLGRAAQEGGVSNVDRVRDELNQKATDVTLQNNKLGQHVDTHPPRQHHQRLALNDPNRILDTATRSAITDHLKLVGDLNKTNDRILKDQYNDQQKLNEQYMTDDVVAGMKARDQAEQAYNTLLDDRLTKIAAINEALKNATDPKKIAMAQEQKSVLLGDVQTIRARQKSAGESAFIVGQSSYLADNSIHSSIMKLFTQYQNEAMSTGKTVSNALSTAFNDAGTALDNFVTTGKFSFKDFTVSVLQDMAKIAAQEAETQLFAFIAKSVGSWFPSSIPTSSANAFDIDYTNFPSVGVHNAKGNAFSRGNLLAFANGGAFTNSIVRQPVTFPLGEMGEAGPEAIMPLTRTSDGSLGIRAVPAGAEKAGGGSNVNISSNFYISNGNASGDTKADNQDYANMASTLHAQMLKTINQELGQGGSINRAIKQR